MLLIHLSRQSNKSRLQRRFFCVLFYQDPLHFTHALAAGLKMNYFSPRPDSTHQENGFSLSLMLVASLTLLLGGLVSILPAMANISVSFQRDGSDALDGGLTALPDLNNRQLKNRAAQQSRGTNPPPAAVLQSV